MQNAELFIPPFESLTDNEYRMLAVIGKDEPEIFHEILQGNERTEDLMYYHIVKKQPKNKNIQQEVRTAETLSKWEQMALEYMIFKNHVRHIITAFRDADGFSGDANLYILPTGLYFTAEESRDVL